MTNGINSFIDFQDYLSRKGYTVFAACEIPNDGFYAEVRKGQAQVKDFTNIGLKGAFLGEPSKNNLDFDSGAVLFPEKYEWVRLSFKDCNNPEIINS